MTKAAIISIDGHVKPSREAYREYISQRFLPQYEEWAAYDASSGRADNGNVNPAFDPAVQWDSRLRTEILEGQGVVAEVLFPNGLPFSMRRFDDATQDEDPALNREARMAYNRWLAEFCAELPGRRRGQALIAFDDIDQAVADVYWAKGHGLGGVMMPALEPGGIFFFDPVLDPVWAACHETGLPISQHGGAGSPNYRPAGYAAIMTLAIEQSFFAGRSLWQMILGGVFERFPNLTVSFIETGANWIAPAIKQLDWRLSIGDDWGAFALFMQRKPEFTKLASEQWATNCFAGVSPFYSTQIDYAELSGTKTDQFQVGSDKTMFGVDFPHFESIAPNTLTQVAQLAAHPAITEADLHKILYQNAASVYSFDLTALAPDIARIGFDPTALA